MEEEEEEEEEEEDLLLFELTLDHALGRHFLEQHPTLQHPGNPRACGCCQRVFHTTNTVDQCQRSISYLSRVRKSHSL